MEKKYLVKINTPNRMIELNGKVVRTPVEHVAREHEIDAIRTKLVFDSLDFLIEEYVKKKEVKKEIIESKKPKVVKKETIKKDSTLGNLLNEE